MGGCAGALLQTGSKVLVGGVDGVMVGCGVS